jgi:hypothetical protein
MLDAFEWFHEASPRWLDRGFECLELGARCREQFGHARHHVVSVDS